MTTTELQKKINQLENRLAKRRHSMTPKTIEKTEDRIQQLCMQFIKAVGLETKNA